MNEERDVLTPGVLGKLKRHVLRLLLLVGFAYLAICLMLAFLQRKLIYVPTKGAVRVEESGFSEDRIEEVFLRVDDNVELHGWYCQCEPTSLRSHAKLAILFPGNAGNRLKRTWWMEEFHEKGCHTLIFDYRAYGGSGGSPSEEKIASDSLKIWEFATNELGFSHDQIVISGQSLGGGVATRLACQKCVEQTPPAGLILQATFTSLVDVAKFNYPWLPVSSLLVERYPSVERIGDVTCPVLVIHGRRDRIVPYELGEQLFSAAPEKSQSGVAKQFVELQEAGHNDIPYVAADDVTVATHQFLDRLEEAIQGN